MSDRIYHYEMHLHTQPCSGGGGDICEHIDDLIEKGYSGAVVTNHFYCGDNRIDRALPWKAFVDAYRQDYLRGLAHAREVDFDLLFGLEEHVGYGQEILIYGISPDCLDAHPELKTATVEQYADFAHSVGGMVYQAHPFRARSYVIRPTPLECLSILDGIEVYNAGNEPEWNESAKHLAEEMDLRCIAGSDAHKVGTAGRAGIATSERLKHNADLIRVLKRGEYTVLCPEDQRGGPASGVTILRR